MVRGGNRVSVTDRFSIDQTVANCRDHATKFFYPAE